MLLSMFKELFLHLHFPITVTSITTHIPALPILARMRHLEAKRRFQEVIQKLVLSLASVKACSCI